MFEKEVGCMNHHELPTNKNTAQQCKSKIFTKQNAHIGSI